MIYSKEKIQDIRQRFLELAPIHLYTYLLPLLSLFFHEHTSVTVYWLSHKSQTSSHGWQPSFVIRLLSNFPSSLTLLSLCSRSHKDYRLIPRKYCAIVHFSLTYIFTPCQTLFISFLCSLTSHLPLGSQSICQRANPDPQCGLRHPFNLHL